MTGKEKTVVLDFVLYLGIAIAVLGIVLGGAFYTAQHRDIDADVIKIPTLLFLVSLLMFGMLVRDYYSHLSEARLRWAILFIFITHIGTGVFLERLHRFQGNYMLLVLIILIPEYLILKKTLGIFSYKRKRSARGRKET